MMTHSFHDTVKSSFFKRSTHTEVETDGNFLKNLNLTPEAVSLLVTIHLFAAAIKSSGLLLRSSTVGKFRGTMYVDVFISGKQ